MTSTTSLTSGSDTHHLNPPDLYYSQPQNQSRQFHQEVPHRISGGKLVTSITAFEKLDSEPYRLSLSRRSSNNLPLETSITEGEGGPGSSAGSRLDDAAFRIHWSKLYSPESNKSGPKNGD